MFKFRPAIASVYWVGALCLLQCATLGCVGTELPNWCNPGPEWFQVSQAKKFDPYPDPTIGPAVVGGRPLAYRDPRPNPDLTKITTSATPLAAPPYATPSAPVYGPPTSYPPPAAYPPPAMYPPPAGYLPPAAGTAPPPAGIAAPLSAAQPIMANPQSVTMATPSQIAPSQAAFSQTAPSQAVHWSGAAPTITPNTSANSGGVVPVAYGTALGTP